MFPETVESGELRTKFKLLCRNVYDRVALMVSPGLPPAEVDAILEKCKADAEAEIEAAVVANLRRLGNVGCELRTKFRRTVIRASPVSTCCAKCGMPAIKKCSGCKIARYCSPQCQQSDWKEHKPLCRNVYDRVALSVSPGLPPAEVDAMLEKCKGDAEAEIEAAVVAKLRRLGYVG